MPVIILHMRSAIPEPGKDRRAQEALWRDINAAVDEFEAKIAALGGATNTEHASKRVAGPRDPEPPPTRVGASQPVDMVDLAQIGTAVTEAAADPAPTRADRRAA